MGPRPTITIDLPSGWARAALAGVSAALIGWFIPVLVAVLAFWGMADSPWLKQDSWQMAVEVGSSFWAVSLGSPALVGGVKLTLVPLLWTFAQVFLVQLMLLYAKSFARTSVWAAVPFFVFTALIVQMATATPVPGSWWRMIIGGSLAAGAGAVFAFQRQRPTDESRPWRLALLRPGIRLGLVWAGGATVISAIGLLISWATQHEAISAAAAVMGATGGDRVVLALVQLAYLPVLMGWAYSWMLGVGFRGAGGHLVTPSTPPERALPLPAWELVPAQAVPFSVWWVVAVGLALGVGSGWFLRKRPVKQALFYLTIASVVFLGYVFVWILLSKGSLGENQLSNLGPPLFTAVGQSILLLVIPAMAIAMLMHPFTIDKVKTWGKEQWATFSNRTGNGRTAAREASPNGDPSEETIDEHAAGDENLDGQPTQNEAQNAPD